MGFGITDLNVLLYKCLVQGAARGVLRDVLRHTDREVNCDFQRTNFPRKTQHGA